MSTIQFDYNLTVQQANQIKEVGTDLQNSCVNTIKEMSTNVDAAWTGDTAKKFKAYLENLETDLTQKVKYLNELSEFLISAAKQMQQAEEAAKQSAQNIG